MNLDRRTALVGSLAMAAGARASARTAAPATGDSPHLTSPDPAETIVGISTATSMANMARLIEALGTAPRR